MASGIGLRARGRLRRLVEDCTQPLDDARLDVVEVDGPPAPGELLSANDRARSQASSAADERCSAWISASLPVSETATRSACISISRDSARCARMTSRKALSVSDLIAQTMSDMIQPIHAMRTSMRERPSRKRSSASRWATSAPAICWAM
jgi:hypothetical protein